MRECSSRNTGQFLDEIDRKHESQLRKSVEEILLINIGLIINVTEKNACNYSYIVYVLYYLVHCMEIAWISWSGDIFNLQCLRKDFN